MQEVNTVLVLNGGSSSLKCGIFRGPGPECEHLLELSVDAIYSEAVFHVNDAVGVSLERKLLQLDTEQTAHGQCLRVIRDWLSNNRPSLSIDVIGHRVVHGGATFEQPQVVDAHVLDSLYQLVPLAPLHQPVNLKLIEHCQMLWPEVCQIACFDTAFHRSRPTVEKIYGLPAKIDSDEVRSFGFHGLSYEYVFNQLAKADYNYTKRRIIIAHLGAGASMCAIRNGASIATTMGFSTAEGLPMATRCGRIDPGVLIYLMRTYQMEADDLESLLYKESGLLGISELSADMRELRNSGDEKSKLAIEYFVHNACKEIGSLAASLGGLDALVFTGGIGENDAATRKEIIDRCGWLGLEIDDRANRQHHREIHHGDNSVRALVIPADEQHMIAQHVAKLRSI